MNGEKPGNFPQTRWSLVLAAGDAENPRTRLALSDLCEAYWEPLYAFLRRKGNDPDRASDLVQGFFARFLAGNYLSRADAEKGKFRTYLLSSLTHHLINEKERERAQKRGGGEAPLSLDVEGAEQRYLDEPAQHLTPERLYERTWVLGQLDRVVDRLKEEYASSGRGAVFDAIAVYLTPAGGPSYADTARDAGMNESAVKVAVHRLRKRYREALREEIASTVETETEIDGEIAYLLSVLAD
ncbi:hypothetical protein ABI59_21675 [Acidobacteria bacterium Mor1]|nr:hypothetical protein ABI59_21675 [Acidobacteria bacterium Mor1]